MENDGQLKSLGERTTYKLLPQLFKHLKWPDLLEARLSFFLNLIMSFMGDT